MGRTAEAPILVPKPMTEEAQVQPAGFRAAIVSHQQLLRCLLAEHLSGRMGATVACTCGSWDEFTKHARTGQPVELLFIDGDLPEQSPLEWMREFSSGSGCTKVAILTDRPAPFFAHLLLQCGLHGLLHKRDSPEVFHSAVTAILAGGVFVSPNIRVGERTLFSRVLSDRETEVLRLLVIGSTAAAVGRQLGISAETVLTHRRNCMRKLGLRSELALALFAVSSGLVAFEQLGSATNTGSRARVRRLPVSG